MNSNQATQLVLDYRPSEFTGWEWGKTLGGNHSAKEFELARRHYQISLLPFGQPASRPSPVYLVLSRSIRRSSSGVLWSGSSARYYSFRYRGGLRGQNQFRVQSYSVFADPKQSSFGAQLYVVYAPDLHAGDPRAEAQLKWIQITRWTGTGSPTPAPYVDNTDCANPFFISGGLISVLGTRVFNFDNPVTAQPTQAHSGTRSVGQVSRRDVPCARHLETRMPLART